VKANQPSLLEALKVWFDHHPQPDTVEWRTTEKRHGRLVRYHVRATPALNDYLRDEFGWRWVGQCVCIQRDCLTTVTSERTAHTHYAITDLSPRQADVRTLFGLWHQHWHIENKGHWVRDVDFEEDLSAAKSRHAPRTLATLRDIAVGLLTLAGATSVATARTALSASLHQAASIVGVPFD
jgi:hypothetical protein